MKATLHCFCQVVADAGGRRIQPLLESVIDGKEEAGGGQGYTGISAAPVEKLGVPKRATEG